MPYVASETTVNGDRDRDRANPFDDGRNDKRRPFFIENAQLLREQRRKKGRQIGAPCFTLVEPSRVPAGESAAARQRR